MALVINLILTSYIVHSQIDEQKQQLVEKNNQSNNVLENLLAKNNFNQYGEIYEIHQGHLIKGLEGHNVSRKVVSYLTVEESLKLINGLKNLLPVNKDQPEKHQGDKNCSDDQKMSTIDPQNYASLKAWFNFLGQNIILNWQLKKPIPSYQFQDYYNCDYSIRNQFNFANNNQLIINNITDGRVRVYLSDSKEKIFDENISVPNINCLASSQNSKLMAFGSLGKNSKDGKITVRKMNRYIYNTISKFKITTDSLRQIFFFNQDQSLGVLTNKSLEIFDTNKFNLVQTVNLFKLPGFNPPITDFSFYPSQNTSDVLYYRAENSSTDFFYQLNLKGLDTKFVAGGLKLHSQELNDVEVSGNPERLFVTTKFELRVFDPSYLDRPLYRIRNRIDQINSVYFLIEDEFIRLNISGFYKDLEVGKLSTGKIFSKVSIDHLELRFCHFSFNSQEKQFIITQKNGHAQIIPIKFFGEVDLNLNHPLTLNVPNL